MNKDLIIAIVIVFCFCFAYFYGKTSGKEEKEKELYKRIKKNEKIAKNIDNSPNSDITKLHDPFE